ncbi:MAG: hypothetical protein QGH33_15985, partial [Pirellulaceae bacterium]|nr:hypothetical protein [Pirellulaceae bacterium]
RPKASEADELQGSVAVIRARILADQSNMLRGDDDRFAVIELRRRLAVAMIGESSSLLVGTLPMHRWISIALAPNLGRENEAMDPIALHEVPITELDIGQLTNMDVAIVVRPDLMGLDGWSALRHFAESGRLVIVIVPQQDTPTSWGATLSESMGVDWQLGLKPITTDEPWSLATDGYVPPTFDQLRVDWQALLRPVRVSKRLTLSIGSGAAKALLRLADQQRSPWMAAADVGDGTLVILASAVDPSWTNLPTKPLWPPLIHELLRGVLGHSGELARLAKVVAGDEPTLGRRWTGAQRLMPWEGLARGESDEAVVADGHLLVRSHNGLKSQTAIERPGVYTSVPPLGMKLAVNVDADAGDTRALDRRAVAEWFAGLGKWRWLEWEAPGAILREQKPRLDITWPLLWITLGLVVAETWLARWFSHTSATAKPAWFGSRIGLAQGES